MPDGVIYHNDGYLCSGANYHSQITAITTLGSVAAVESQVEENDQRSLSAADGCKLSYLLPQSTTENASRVLPESLPHAMEDGVRVLNFNAGLRDHVQHLLYTPNFEMKREVSEGLADGDSYLRGFELLRQPVKFFGRCGERSACLILSWLGELACRLSSNPGATWWNRSCYWHRPSEKVQHVVAAAHLGSRRDQLPTGPAVHAGQGACYMGTFAKSAQQTKKKRGDMLR